MVSPFLPQVPKILPTPLVTTLDLPPYIHPVYRPPPKPPDSENIQGRKTLEIDADISVDIEENFPYQEGIIAKTYKRPDRSYVTEPSELGDLVNTSKLVQKYLPKQADINRILGVIQRKVLKGIHLSLTIKEIQAGYLTGSYFKDLYL